MQLICATHSSVATKSIASDWGWRTCFALKCLWLPVIATLITWLLRPRPGLYHLLFISCYICIPYMFMAAQLEYILYTYSICSYCLFRWCAHHVCARIMVLWFSIQGISLLWARLQFPICNIYDLYITVQLRCKVMLICFQDLSWTHQWPCPFVPCLGVCFPCSSTVGVFPYLSTYNSEQLVHLTCTTHLQLPTEWCLCIWQLALRGFPIQPASQDLGKLLLQICTYCLYYNDLWLSIMQCTLEK